MFKFVTRCWRFLNKKRVCCSHFSSQKKPPTIVPCTLIPGDYVGEDVTETLLTVFEAGKFPVRFEVYPLSEINPIPNITMEDVIDSIAYNRVCIKGALDRNLKTTTMKTTIKTQLRVLLDVFVGVSHAYTLPGAKTKLDNVDSIIIRESIEGEYSALEREAVPGVVESLKVITRRRSRRVAKFAFDFAIKYGRKKVTVIHKANIMKLSDGLFLKTCEDVSKLYPTIKCDKMIVDNTTMQMVAKPHQFDVMVMPSLYGSIIVNLAAGLVGGSSFVAGALYSKRIVIFEPGSHHLHSDPKDKGYMNPTAILLCAVGLLDHLHMYEEKDKLYKALTETLKEGSVKTRDMGGNATTKDFVCAITEKF